MLACMTLFTLKRLMLLSSLTELMDRFLGAIVFQKMAGGEELWCCLLAEEAWLEETGNSCSEFVPV
jgi:hypothetical protein